jgi:hypothetical protein
MCSVCDLFLVWKNCFGDIASILITTGVLLEVFLSKTQGRVLGSSCHHEYESRYSRVADGDSGIATEGTTFNQA